MSLSPAGLLPVVVIDLGDLWWYFSPVVLLILVMVLVTASIFYSLHQYYPISYSFYHTRL